jgi:hypothetical protein
MSMIEWVKTEAVGGNVFTSEAMEDYDIFQATELQDKFFVRRHVAECDDIGPLDTFKDAEDVIIKIGICLTQYEEGLWRVIAAQAIKMQPAFYDGTANVLEELAP